MSEPRVITLQPRVPTHRLEAFLSQTDTRKRPQMARVVEIELARRRVEERAARKQEELAA